MSNLSRQALRRKTLNYYKRLMWVGKDWPDGGLETVRRRAKPQFFKGILFCFELIFKKRI